METGTYGHLIKPLSGCAISGEDLKKSPLAGPGGADRMIFMRGRDHLEGVDLNLAFGIQKELGSWHGNMDPHSKNCAEWFITDLAMMLGDYISVPVFPTAGAETIEYCVTHSESKVLRLWEQAGNGGLVEVTLPNGSNHTRAYPCNLRDEITNEEGIAILNHSFQLLIPNIHIEQSAI